MAAECNRSKCGKGRLLISANSKFSAVRRLAGNAGKRQFEIPQKPRILVTYFDVFMEFPGRYWPVFERPGFKTTPMFTFDNSTVISLVLVVMVAFTAIYFVYLRKPKNPKQ